MEETKDWIRHEFCFNEFYDSQIDKIKTVICMREYLRKMHGYQRCECYLNSHTAYYYVYGLLKTIVCCLYHISKCTRTMYQTSSQQFCCNFVLIALDETTCCQLRVNSCEPWTILFFSSLYFITDSTQVVTLQIVNFLNKMCNP